jgi:hypothetical protein
MAQAPPLPLIFHGKTSAPIERDGDESSQLNPVELAPALPALNQLVKRPFGSPSGCLQVVGTG